MTTRSLHLRTPRYMADVAAQLAHQLWNDLANLPGYSLDVHSYVAFEQRVRRILSTHVEDCDAGTDEGCWRAWSQTGGSVPGHPIRGEICRFHEARLLEESKEAIDLLMKGLEAAVGTYIAERSAQGKIGAAQQTAIASTLQSVAKPYLVKNLGSSCCDRCSD